MGGGRWEDLRGVVVTICARIFFAVVGIVEFVVFAGGFEKKWRLDVVF
jgi:hypothetical protein